MEADRKGLISLRNGKDGTINCHIVRYNSGWQGQWKKQGKESAQRVSSRNTWTSQCCKPPLFKGYLHMWPGKKSNSYWMEGGKKEKKVQKEETEEVSYLNHTCLPLLTPTSCVVGVPRGKKSTAFLSYYCLFSAPQTQPCQVKNGSHQLCGELHALPWQSGGEVS